MMCNIKWLLVKQNSGRGQVRYLDLDGCEASDALLYYVFQSCMESIKHSSGFHTGKELASQNHGRRSSKDEPDAFTTAISESVDATHKGRIRHAFG